MKQLFGVQQGRGVRKLTLVSRNLNQLPLTASTYWTISQVRVSVFITGRVSSAHDVLAMNLLIIIANDALTHLQFPIAVGNEVKICWGFTGSLSGRRLDWIVVAPRTLVTFENIVSLRYDLMALKWLGN